MLLANPLSPLMATLCRRLSIILLSCCLLIRQEALPDTALDPEFSVGTGTDWFAEHVLPLPNGKILLCGLFTSFNGVNAPYLVRLNENGSLDPTFKTGLINYWTRHMLVQADGKIVIAGAFTNVAGETRNLIARLNEDGSLDPTFQPGVGFEEKIVPEDPNPPLIFWMAQQTDGKIVVVGSFAKLNGKPMRGIARLNADGSADDSFHVGQGFNSWGRFVRILPNGQILATGWFTQYDNFTCNRMVRLNPDGSADQSFHPYFGDLTAIYSAAPLPDGKMIVSGHTKNESAFTRHIARLNADGSEDTSFLGSSNNRTESILIQPDGKILVCGFFDLVDGTTRYRLARLNADGTLDTTFKADLDNWAWTMAYDNKQRLLVAGMFHTVNGVQSIGLVRLLPDLSIGPGATLQADDKSISTAEDQTASVLLTGSGPTGAQLSYRIATQPTEGKLSGSGANITYTPNPNFNGTDSFTYTVSAAGAESSPATVTITITPVNDPPTANDISVSTTRGTPIAIELAGSDPDGETISFQTISPPSHGQLSGTPPHLTYTPNAAFSGTDLLTYIAKDSSTQSGSATVTIHVVAQNNPPTAQDISFDASPAVPVDVTLRGADPDGDTLTFRILSPPQKGVLSGTSPNIKYTAVSSSIGSDTFTYSASDGSLESPPATVTVNILPGNHSPLASAIDLQIADNQTAAILLTGSDADGDSLTFQLVSGPTSGRLSGTAPTLTYTPQPGFSGNDVFSYTVSDGKATSPAATVTVHVIPSQHRPVATNLSIDTLEDQAVNFSLGGTDLDGDSLTYLILNGPSKGTLTGTGSAYTYTPNLNANGPDSFSYVVSDGVTVSDPALVTIRIAAQNDPPTVQSVSVNTSQGSPVDFTLPADDADSDSLTFNIVTAPTKGTLTGIGPHLTYTPNAGARGQDSFTYFAADASSQSTLATVTINIASINQPPIAAGLQVLLNEDETASIVLPGSDPDGEPLQFLIKRLPTAGHISGTPPNIVYQPVRNYHGTDSFSYVVSDGSLTSAEAEVTLTIVAVNDSPLSSNLSLDTKAGFSLPVNLGGSDPDGDAVTFRVVTPPTKGTLSGNPPHLTYVSRSDQSGMDQFEYVVNDGTADSRPGVVSIFIVPSDYKLKADSVRLTGGAVDLNISGHPNSLVSVQCSTDAIHWTDLAQTRCDSAGKAWFQDTAPLAKLKLYRFFEP